MLAKGHKEPGMTRHLWIGAVLVATLAVPIVRAAEESASSYVIGPNDVLVVTVFNQPQLSGKYVVEADGMFTFPLLGRVKVGGMSVRAVEDEVRNRLGRGYLKDPLVSVAVDQYRSQQIFVIGEVRQPGGLAVSGAVTLIEALARAGSVTERAGGEVVIVRPKNGAAAGAPVLPSEKPSDSEVLHVDLQTLQQGAMAQNVALRGGDTIFVPRAATVFVTGQVRSAGEFVLRRNMTVRQAIALAGGMTDRGSGRRIQILRLVSGEEVTLDADQKDQVQAGDTIVVRERYF
jgi:polysaccharide export outer membrane protein